MVSRYELLYNTWKRNSCLAILAAYTCSYIEYTLCTHAEHMENGWGGLLHLCIATDAKLIPELKHSCAVHTAEYWSDV